MPSNIFINGNYKNAKIRKIFENISPIVGTVYINNCEEGVDTTIPLGDYKQSGIGRDNSYHALLKTIFKLNLHGLK